MKKSEIAEKYIKRFWNRVDKKDKDECWEWLWGTNAKGYGRISIDYQAMLAHRVSYILHHGELDDEKVVCHTCHNTGCVNPNHLYAGTQADNLNDMKKARRRKLLSIEQIKEIRRLFLLEYGTPFLMKKYNCSEIVIIDATKDLPLNKFRNIPIPKQDAIYDLYYKKDWTMAEIGDFYGYNRQLMPKVINYVKQRRQSYKTKSFSERLLEATNIGG